MQVVELYRTTPKIKSTIELDVSIDLQWFLSLFFQYEI